MLRRAAVVVIALAACGEPGERPVDAAPPVDAPSLDGRPIDGPRGPSCIDGGRAEVVVELGGGAEPRTFSHAWFNHGHETKACFAVDVVLSSVNSVEGSYLDDPLVLEVVFDAEPVLGTNEVRLHLHQPDVRLRGTVEVSSLLDNEVGGVISAVGAEERVTGMFTARRCAGVFDPCL